MEKEHQMQLLRWKANKEKARSADKSSDKSTDKGKKLKKSNKVSEKLTSVSHTWRSTYLLTMQCALVIVVLLGSFLWFTGRPFKVFIFLNCWADPSTVVLGHLWCDFPSSVVRIQICHSLRVWVFLYVWVAFMSWRVRFRIERNCLVVFKRKGYTDWL